MTCQLLETIKIHNLEQLIHHLHPELPLSSELNRDDDYDNRWSWDDEGPSKSNTCSYSKILKTCPMALSVDLVIMAFGNGRNLVVYRSDTCFESSVPDAKHDWTKCLVGLSLPEYITSLAIIPLKSKKGANSTVWNAIIVGTSSGLVEIYSDDGFLLLSQKLDDCDIKSVKHWTDNPRNGLIVFLCECFLILTEVASLHKALCSARNTRLRCDEDIDLGLKIVHKKILFNSNVVNDVFILEYNFPKKDVCKLEVATTGIEPFFSIQVSSNDFVPSIRDVAQVAFSMAKSYIPIFGRKSQEPTPSSLRSTYSLHDQCRNGTDIAVSSNKKYCAVCDELGRVSVIDILERAIVKSWEGHHDATCSWIDVSDTNRFRNSSCLVIYSSKKQLLEVWIEEDWLQIASIRVENKSRLFSITIGETPGWVSSCWLFDCENGTISRLDVPFVCTLKEDDDQCFKSTHLLIEFKKLIRNRSNQTALDIFLRIEGRSYQIDAIQYLVSEMDEESLVEVLSEYREAMKELKAVKDPISDYECKLVLQMISRTQNLIRLYQDLRRLNEQNQVNEIGLDTATLPDDIDSFALDIGWKATDVAKCISLFNLRSTVIPVMEKELPSVMSLVEFLSIFNTFETQVIKNGGEVVECDVPVEISWKNVELNDLRAKLSMFIFGPYFHGAVEEEYFLKILDESHVKSSCLLKSVALCWLSTEVFTSSCINWKLLTKAVKKFAKNLNETSDDNSLTVSWRSVCGLIVSCSRLSSALIAAYAINSVLSETWFSKSLSDDPKSLGTQDNEWETLYIDHEKLNILLKQLEDIFLLDLLLKTSKKFNTDITLYSLIKSDSGCVSQLVAKWVVASQIRPNVLINFCGETQIAEEGIWDVVDDANEAVFLESLDLQSVSELVSHVGRRFPASMEYDTLAANCCWESLNLWLKNPSTSSCLLQLSIEYLSSISLARLKHNLSCFIWTQKLSQMNESICVILDKMGKIPKSSVCQEIVGLPEECLNVFVNYSHNLLETILNNTEECVEQQPMNFAVDDYWTSSDNHESALIQALCKISTSNQALVTEQLRLITIIRFIVTFHLNGIRPLSYFPQSTRQFLFKNITSQAFVPAVHNDYQLFDIRTKLVNCFTYAIAENVTISSGADVSLGCDRSKTLLSANKWFGEVLVLSREWELDLDQIRRAFARDLYLNSVDDLAHEILCTVGDRSEAISELLPIAGYRMISLLGSCPPGTEELLPVPLLEWLKTIHKNGSRNVKTSKDSTKKLLHLILNEVSDVDSFNYKLINEMIKSLGLIVE